MTEVERHYEKWRKASVLLKVALVCVLTVAAVLSLYQYDNKYTAKGPKAINGVLTLDEQILAAYPCMFLIDGWEYYGGKLLTPQDFTNTHSAPDRHVFIGQFGGFEARDKNASPHGSATYRLNIKIPVDVISYALELPEIFSAYRLYINGRQIAEMGDPDPQSYRPETGNRTVVIEAGGNIEILFAISDFSHLYSGMVYPPAFGQPDAVAGLLNTRITLRSVLCASALTIGLLSILIGFLSKKNKLSTLYGLLCLFFVGYTCYPITRTLITGFQPQYAIENFSFCAMLTVVAMLTYTICGLTEKRGGILIRVLILFGLLMCAVSAISPFLWRIGSLRVMMAYSNLISAYELMTSVLITLIAAWTMLKYSARAETLLYGIIIFDIALVMDRLLPLYEPIVTGWFAESAGFALVISLGIIIGQKVAANYRDNAILTERAGSMERLYQSQQSYFTALRQEMEESKKMRHDLKHHFTMIDGFIQNSQFDKLSSYVSEYKTAFNKNRTAEYCPINVINVLSHHYDMLAEQHGIHFDIRCDMGAGSDDQKFVNMTDADLCCLYSNLMENALEACLRVKTGECNIYVAVARTGPGSLTIRVRNNTDGNLQTGNDIFISSKSEARMGYGLLSIRSIAGKYGGTASFSWDKDERMFDSTVSVMA